MALVRELRSLGRDAWLFLSEIDEKTGRLINVTNFDQSWIWGAELTGKTWDFIILDRFQTPPEEFYRWEKVAALIGIDEGGPCRNNFDFLIDILPNVISKSIEPNISDPSLLPLPAKKEKPQRQPAPLKVMVSFGQEDTDGLGAAAAKELAARNSAGVMNITLLGGWKRTPIPNLSERLSGYDLLVTHYGITAFEALYAGIPVLLLSPGPYHEELAKAAGFCSAGIGPQNAKKLAGLLFLNKGINNIFLEELKKTCAALAVRHNVSAKPKQSLAALLNSFSPDPRRNCPVCGALLKDSIVARYPQKSYRRCPACAVISMDRVNPPPIEYGREYFFDLYREQYGKTYIEDFPKLINMGKRRLAVIRKLLPAADKPEGLLDIGCAYGPFLAAAKETGFSPFGIDPAKDAVRYVTQTIGIPAAQGYFPDCLISGDTVFQAPFDVVTLWYVLEHFPDCKAALTEIKRVLRPGGIVAFSTPSYTGISGRVSPKRFLQQSPEDHWTIWSTVMCKKNLKKAGFRVKKIVSTGHHPERFPALGRFARGKKSPLYALLLALSGLFRLGDTFEVYAELAQ
jgi:SAM-dependent methyltransferase